ncbi:MULTISPECIES: hypothetical protein [unclassified Xanthobacter]|uniref:hypothetical protein n=1 Tax=unclassified Xanthobacter TaxID=2623496 RepID=UPI001F30BDDA|nr:MULTISPECIES: hypothetical protein [unclassified Xanthobacter]
MEYDWDQVGPMATECGLKQFATGVRISSLPSSHVEEMRGAWAARVREIYNSPAIWSDRETFEEASRDADAYAGFPRAASLSRRMDDYWPFLAAFERFEQGNRLQLQRFDVIPFEPTQVRPAGHRDLPLLVIVRPGDIYADLDAKDGDAEFTARILAGQAADIRSMLDEQEVDVVVLHHRSDVQLRQQVPAGDPHIVERAEYVQSVAAAMKRGALVWAREMTAVAAWLVAEQSAAERPAVVLIGAHAAADCGPTAILGAALEEAGVQVELNEFVPATSTSYDGRWEPEELQASHVSSLSFAPGM